MTCLLPYVRVCVCVRYAYIYIKLLLAVSLYNIYLVITAYCLYIKYRVHGINRFRYCCRDEKDVFACNGS